VLVADSWLVGDKQKKKKKNYAFVLISPNPTNYYYNIEL